MSGKMKSQRTKNHAKPSNSTRSAELLDQLGSNSLVFGTHSSGLNTCNLGNILQPNVNNISNLPAEIQIMLKRMTKKDSTTKVKALKELYLYLSRAEINILQDMLLYWPNLYQNLANFGEHRVREAAQELQSLIVLKCKKLVAPYLKQLVPTWIASHYDSHLPASSISYSSFKKAFPGEKAQKVCLFCHDEIMDFVVYNLTILTPALLKISKNCEIGEAEQMYQRIVFSCLKSVSFFLEQVRESEAFVLSDRLEGLLKHQKLWSYSKHPSSQIKSAWFELMKNILQSNQRSSILIKKQLITHCFQNISETNPMVTPHVWGCILFLQSRFKDWSFELHLKKDVYARTPSILYSCCKGNAKTICPSLLPFISKISEITPDTDFENFVTHFFETFKKIMISNELSSKSDFSIFACSYFQCLKFIFESANKFTNSLLSNFFKIYVIEIVQWGLTTESFAYKYIFKHSFTVLEFLAQKNEPCLFKSLLNEFWNEINSTFYESVSQTMAKDTYINNFAELITTLYFGDQNIKSDKVQFSDSKTENRKESFQENLFENSFENVQYSNSLHNSLSKPVVLFIKYGVQEAHTNPSALLFKVIGKVTKCFSNYDFYTKISTKDNIYETLDIFTSFIKNYDYDPMEIVVDIIFDILSHLNSQEGIIYINDLLFKIKRPIVRKWIICRLLSHPLCAQMEVQKLTSEKHVIDVILETLKIEIETNSPESFNMLHKIFAQNDSGKTIVNDLIIDGIVQILLKAMCENTSKQMVDSCAHCLTQIIPIICTNNNSSASIQVETFLKLFEFSIENFSNPDLSKDTLSEVTENLTKILSSKKNVIESIIIPCQDIVMKFLTQSSLTINKMDNISNLVSKLIMSAAENDKDKLQRFLKIDFLIHSLLETDESKNFRCNQIHMLDFCTFIEAMKGLLPNSLEYDLTDENLKNVDLKPFIKWNFFRLYVTTNIVTEIENKNEFSQNENLKTINDCFDDATFKHLFKLLQEIINIVSACESLYELGITTDVFLQNIIIEMDRKVKYLLQYGSPDLIRKLQNAILIEAAQNKIMFCRSILYFYEMTLYEKNDENSELLLAEEINSHFTQQETFSGYINILQYLSHKLDVKMLIFKNSMLDRARNNIWSQATLLRCIIKQNFSDLHSDISNKNIITTTLQFIVDVAEQQHLDHDELLYNIKICDQPYSKITSVVKYIYFLIEVIEKISHNLKTKHWDIVRLSLSSWAVTVSKSVDNWKKAKVAIFISSVYKLFSCLVECFDQSENNISPELYNIVKEEWENLFARDVNLVLFKSFYTLLQSEGQNSECLLSYSTLINETSSSLEFFNFALIYQFYRHSNKVAMNDLIHLLLNNISKPIHSIRTSCLYIIKRLAPFFIEEDYKYYKSYCFSIEEKNVNGAACNWHFLNNFKEYIDLYEKKISKYLDEFSFKITELSTLSKIDRDEAFSFLFLWECIVHICSQAPSEIKFLYTTWVNENNFQQSLLLFLFRAMPCEVLKSYDSKCTNIDLFKCLSWKQKKDNNLSVEIYACNMYTDVLRQLPATVRKWWSTSDSRQKSFIDKLTSNYVSGILCKEELKNISLTKEKLENMTVIVHASTREVLAVYLIDEVRMELTITLSKNYPLGGVKVDCGKQIGGQISSRSIGMQLTLFLMHQDGTILDGLKLWKKNLDKKFDGVEECYVCYTVIHQETCQLPKLTCKTCKKKFHGPCLYKWFTTSSKSTCPICRNMF